MGSIELGRFYSIPQASKLSGFLGLAFSLTVFMSYATTSATESQDGLAITHGAGDTVNVSLDTESSFNVSIRRNEQAMIIRIPPSFHSKLYIDPALKSNHIIQESETNNGRTIVIQSQQIYLSTHESGTKATTTAAKKEILAAESNEEKEAKTLRDEGIIKPVFKESLPYEAFPNSTDAKLAAQKSHTGLLSLTDDSAKLALSGQKKEHGKKDDKSKSKNQKDAKKNAAKNHYKIATLDSLKTKKANLNEKTAHRSKDVTSVNEADPESQPLDPLSNAEDPLGHTPALGWFRMTVSLIIVLSMALGCVRWLLPKLLARYPEFFERLKSRQLTGQQFSNPYRSTPVIQPKPVYFANNMQPSQNMQSPQNNSIYPNNQSYQPNNQSNNQPYQNIDFPASPVSIETSMNPPVVSMESSPSTINPPPNPVANAESVKQTLSPNSPLINRLSPTQPVSTSLTLSGQPMQVITSSSLEDGKALHLVDIQGRQFLVASTPDNITLLKDLSASLDENEISKTQNKSFATRPSQPYTISTSLPKPYCVDAEEVVILPDYDDVYNSNM